MKKVLLASLFVAISGSAFAETKCEAFMNEMANFMNASKAEGPGMDMMKQMETQMRDEFEKMDDKQRAELEPVCEQNMAQLPALHDAWTKLLETK